MRGGVQRFFWCEGEAKLRAKGTTRVDWSTETARAKKEKASDQDVDREKIITHQDSSNWTLDLLKQEVRLL